MVTWYKYNSVEQNDSKCLFVVLCSLIQTLILQPVCLCLF